MSATPRKRKHAVVGEIAALAFAGRHAQAIEKASEALAARLSSAERLDLLDLRAESALALGDIARAVADAQAMCDIAKRSRDATFLAQALNRRAFVEIRSGNSRTAIDTAQEARKAARSARRRDLEGISLLRLAEAQFRVRSNEPAVKAALAAAQLWKTLRQPMYEGRALWAVAAARSGQGRVADADAASRQAVDLARTSGDLYGLGNALNMLTFHEPDLAARKPLLHQALAAFEAAGYVERQAVITHNLGNLYHELGLDRRARRLLARAGESYRRAGAVGAGLGTNLWMLAHAEHGLGNEEAAKARVLEAADVWSSSGLLMSEAYLRAVHGQLALWEGDPAKAAARYDESARAAKDTDEIAIRLNALIGATEAHLAAGNPAAALESSELAAAIHRKHKLADIQGISTTDLGGTDTKPFAPTEWPRRRGARSRSPTRSSSSRSASSPMKDFAAITSTSRSSIARS